MSVTRERGCGNEWSAAVVLVSGGLDSATVLGMARADGRVCHALTVDYGQRHVCEVDAACRVARALGVASHRIVRVDLRALGGSALTDEFEVPKDRGEAEIGRGIPATYVPARNMVLLSIATGLAEVVGAGEVHIGVSAVDSSGYPDCRAGFIAEFQRAAWAGTKAGVDGHGVRVVAPLLEMSKAEIVRRGLSLGVDYGLTHSCYDPGAGRLACGRCDACVLRRRGFELAGVADPTGYVGGSSRRAEEG